METDVEDTARHFADLAKRHDGLRDSRYRCTIWTTYDPKTVERDLRIAKGTFVLCEYPERPFAFGCVMDVENCPNCRIVLAAMAHENPGLVLHLSRDKARDLGRQQEISAAEFCVMTADETEDPALVSAAARLASRDAVS